MAEQKMDVNFAQFKFWERLTIAWYVLRGCKVTLQVSEAAEIRKVISMIESSKLVQQAGLKVWQDPCSSVPVVNASDVESLLREAPVVYCPRGNKDYWYAPGENEGDPTHTARLICIQPIVRDTAENLLREMIDLFEDKPPLGPKLNTCEWINRARKLLGQEGE